MRLTLELREQYISKAIKEIESITGIIVPVEMLRYDSYDKKAKMVEVPIVFNCRCLAVDSDDSTLGEMKVSFCDKLTLNQLQNAVQYLLME